MTLLTTLYMIKDWLDLPTTILFFCVGVLLTLKTRCMQLRGLPRFFSLITAGIKRKKVHNNEGEVRTIDTFHALFTAMSTTIGIGNLVGPSVAIYAGGPGALFWLLVYIFFGSVTKFVEVIFAMRTRIRTDKGEIIGGPMQYLKEVNRFFAYWFMYVMAGLFIGWSMVQANTLAAIYAQEGIPEWVSGIVLAALACYVLLGGAVRAGNVASKLVPIMFIFYAFFAFFILFKDMKALHDALALITCSILSPSAPAGAFLGASVYQAVRCGLYEGMFITEAGLGTSSIAHALADTKRPVDQGVLAMYSMVADAVLALTSGLIVLVTGVWQHGLFRSTLIYEAFKLQAPFAGQFVLLVSVSLFVITTIIGNSFNGCQTFASITNSRGIHYYLGVTIICIFIGAMVHVEVAWLLMKILISLVAIPNLIGITILAFRHADAIEL